MGHENKPHLSGLTIAERLAVKGNAKISAYLETPTVGGLPRFGLGLIQATIGDTLVSINDAMHLIGNGLAGKREVGVKKLKARNEKLFDAFIEEGVDEDHIALRKKYGENYI